MLFVSGGTWETTWVMPLPSLCPSAIRFMPAIIKYPAYIAIPALIKAVMLKFLP